MSYHIDSEDSSHCSEGSDVSIDLNTPEEDDLLKEEEAAEDPPGNGTPKTTFRDFLSKMQLVDKNFKVDSRFPGVVKKNTSEFPEDNIDYARVEGPEGVFHRGIRGASAVYVLCPEADDKAINVLLKNAKKMKGAKSIGTRQVNTKKMYELSRKYLTTGSTANAPKEVFELFGGAKAPILMTTEHATRVETQKNKMKRDRESDTEDAKEEQQPVSKKAKEAEKPKAKEPASISQLPPPSAKIAHKQAKVAGQLAKKETFEITKDEKAMLAVLSRVLTPLLAMVREA
jgi:hypothetical protein